MPSNIITLLQNSELSDLSDNGKLSFEDFKQYVRAVVHDSDDALARKKMWLLVYSLSLSPAFTVKVHVANSSGLVRSLSVVKTYLEEGILFDPVVFNAVEENIYVEPYGQIMDAYCAMEDCIHIFQGHELEYFFDQLLEGHFQAEACTNVFSEKSNLYSWFVHELLIAVEQLSLPQTIFITSYTIDRTKLESIIFALE